MTVAMRPLVAPKMPSALPKRSIDAFVQSRHKDQPGHGSGTRLQSLTIPEVLRCALSDGFFDHCKGKRNRTIKIWFCVAPGWDYHWYRQTEPMGGEERWCHKMGGTPARNTDDSGQYITDPRTADRGSYTSEGIFLYYNRRSNKTVI